MILENGRLKLNVGGFDFSGVSLLGLQMAFSLGTHTISFSLIHYLLFLEGHQLDWIRIHPTGLMKLKHLFKDLQSLFEVLRVRTSTC